MDKGKKLLLKLVNEKVEPNERAPYMEALQDLINLEHWYEVVEDELATLSQVEDCGGEVDEEERDFFKDFHASLESFEYFLGEVKCDIREYWRLVDRRCEKRYETD